MLNEKSDMMLGGMKKFLDEEKAMKELGLLG